MFWSVTPIPAAQRALETTVAASAVTGYADLLALEVGNALDVAATGYEQLGAAGVEAGGELDGQAVLQRLEHFLPIRPMPTST